MLKTSRFIIHRHKTAKPHFDLRLIFENQMRCWSILREPICKEGEKRLAIEREIRSLEDLDRTTLYEDAFGPGKVWIYDEGEFVPTVQAPGYMVLEFRGNRLAGRYELRRMRWYPGNRWLLKNIGP